MIYLFLLIGILLNWGFVLHSALNKSDFELQYFVKQNYMKFIADLTFCVIVGYNTDYLNNNLDFIGVQINTFTALFIGYTSGNLFHIILKKIRK